MYQFIKAVCIARTIGSQWKEIDLSNILVYDIYNTYSKIYLELSTIYLEGPIYVDMDSLRAEFSSFNGTLNELLVHLGNRTLETVSELPNTQISYVKYSDAFRSGYKVATTEIGLNLPENYPASEFNDLAIWRPRYETDMSLIHSHCLVTVNGYIHHTDTDGEKAYVYDGAITMRHSRNNHLGIMSFLDVGELTKVPVDLEKIHGQDDTSPLKTRTYIELDQDLTGKSILLVLGGYLIFPEAGIFWQSGDKTVAINFAGMPLLERYFESKLYIDLSSLNLQVSTANPEMINVEELLSDAVLKRYLTLSQSFLVIVNTPNLFTNKIFLRHCSLPGMFTAYQDPVYPLIVNYGKMVEYWKTFEDGQWSVTVEDSFYRNFVLSYKPTRQLMNVTPNAIPMNPYYHSQGFLLEIGSFK